MKTYVKPDVFYEDFELSVGVAACTLLVFNKDGSVKSYNKNDEGNKYLETEGYFGNTCTIPMTSDIYYNYFGDNSGEVFGS